MLHTLAEVIAWNTLYLSLLTSCGGSRIPDDSKYVVYFPEEICEEMYDVLVCHAAEGRLVKEGKNLYFVDHQNVFHTTVIDKTRVYQGTPNNQIEDTKPLLKDGEECIAVMGYYRFGIPCRVLNIHEPKKYDRVYMFSDVVSELYFDVDPDSVTAYAGNTSVIWY